MPAVRGEESFPSCCFRATGAPAYLPVRVIAPATCTGGQGDCPGVCLAPHPAQDEVPGPAAPRASCHAVLREVSWGARERRLHTAAMFCFHPPPTGLCPLKQPFPGHHSPAGNRSAQTTSAQAASMDKLIQSKFLPHHEPLQTSTSFTTQGQLLPEPRC